MEASKCEMEIAIQFFTSKYSKKICFIFNQNLKFSEASFFLEIFFSET